MAGPYWLNSYVRVLGDLRPLFQVNEPAVLRMNLSRLSFMGPAALATTAAAIMKFVDSGLSLPGGTIVVPQAPGIRRYLERMDFFDVSLHLEGGQRTPTEGLLECQHFSDDSNIRPVTQSILEVIETKTAIDATARYALDTCLSEVLENVMFHAYTDFGGVAAVQAFKGELEVAIVDLGDGIAASLARNPDYAEAASQGDLVAVQTAIMPNVTSTPERNKGWGLAFTELLLGLNEGWLEVRSGEGQVRRGAKVADKVSKHSLPGTLVAMRIRLDQPLDYSKAWKLLGDAVDSLDEP